MAFQKAKLIKKRSLTNDVIELIFETKDNFKFTAGQFITIKINDKLPSPCLRGYSISSRPSGNIFELCVKIIPQGRGSNWLNSLKKDNEIEFIGPNGKFIFNTDSSKKILLIGAGTGIAPLKSIAENELLNGNKQTISILWGLRYIKDIFYKDYFENLVHVHKNLSFEITLSQSEKDDWKGKRGRVTEILKNLPVKDFRDTEAYICGLRHMVEDVKTILKEKGLTEKEIHFEKYD